MEKFKDDVLEDLGKKLLELNSKIGDYIIENKIEIPKNKTEYGYFIENEFENDTDEIKKIKKEFVQTRLKMIEHCKFKGYSPIAFAIILSDILRSKNN